MFTRTGTPEAISQVKAEEIVQSVECPKCKKQIEAIKRKDNVTTISGAYIILGKVQMTCPHCKESVEV